MSEGGLTKAKLSKVARILAEDYVVPFENPEIWYYPESGVVQVGNRLTMGIDLFKIEFPELYRKYFK